ncbi:MAG: 16S rRNA (cytosine(1402)-N(4))-methyltransferase RsmH [Planctomycetia bacterium]|nr:16S rRNA (cytosine(1402)-N(4))-methyltransferase RsmH [Planctomycetia bacterium]
MEPSANQSEQTVHLPVLYREVLEGLSPVKDGIYIDGTLGGGGHSLGILRKAGPNGLVIGIDRDPTAIRRAEDRIRTSLENDSEYQGQNLPIRFAQANYRDFPMVLNLLKIEKINGFLLDLGLSSDQLADRDRGFSFDSEGDLDLRFDPTEGLPAYELLNRWSEEKIADVIFQYGEERYSRRIARAIAERRVSEPLRKAADLAGICRRCIPHPPGRQRIDPATRTFQALRIAVNEELDSLKECLETLAPFLASKGRVAVISFHSLEDRIVKNFFRDAADFRIITKKPIEAGEEELDQNPRSRSAKLRIAEKI